MFFFFARPLHIFNIVLLIKIWQMLSYGPSTIHNYFNGMSAVQATQALWQQEFSPYVWYFLFAAIADVAVQEFLPLIKND